MLCICWIENINAEHHTMKVGIAIDYYYKQVGILHSYAYVWYDL